MKRIGVAIVGFGTVGRGVLKTLREQAQRMEAKIGTRF